MVYFYRKKNGLNIIHTCDNNKIKFNIDWIGINIVILNNEIKKIDRERVGKETSECYCPHDNDV